MKTCTAFLRLVRLVPRTWLTWLLLLNVLSAVTEGAGIVMLVPLLDVLSGKSGNVLSTHLIALMQRIHLPFGLVSVFGIFLFLIVLRATAQYGREMVGHHVRNHVITSLRYRAFSCILYAEWRWLKSKRSTDFVNLLLNDINRISIVVHYGCSLFSGVITIAASLVVALSLSFWQSVVVCGTGGLFFFMMSGLRKRALLLGRELTESNRQLHATVQESFDGLRLIKIWGTQQQHLSYLMNMVEAVSQNQVDFSRSHGRSMMLFQIMAALFLTLFLYTSINVWHTPVPVLLTLVVIFARFVPQFITLHQQLHHWLHAFPAWIELDNVLAQARQHSDTDSMAETESLAAMSRAIRLENVSVLYANGKVKALDNVSLELPMGKTTVIYGPSGAGKSTLLDVIAGLVIPDSGGLYVDESEITASNRRGWQNQIAYVPQEVYLFHESIRENLLRAKPDASESELLAALDMASAMDFVQAQPQGMDTVVGDKGGRLSGGERQRIALARALLLKPNLLILDEATSALDMGHQLKINEVLKNLQNKMTILVVTHNLSIGSFADQVVCIEHGHLQTDRAMTELSGRQCRYESE